MAHPRAHRPLEADYSDPDVIRVGDDFYRKGARVGIFCYGRDGHVDVDYVRCVYGSPAR